MRIVYEKACREAGLPEEKIKEIRRMFDADYKRLKRRKAAKNRTDHIFYSFELMIHPGGDSSPYYFQDPDIDVEKIVHHRLDLERLQGVLNRIPVRDMEFILDCFDAEWGARKQVAEKYGMTLGAVKQKKKRVMKQIRKLFFEGEET